MNRLNPVAWWRWLFTPDRSPGLSAPKIAKLMLRAFLFALVAVLLQTALVALRVPYMNTIWGQLAIVILLYIPFARYLAMDMVPPERGVRGRTGRNGKPIRKLAKRKYAGVKKSGPRF